MLIEPREGGADHPGQNAVERPLAPPFALSLSLSLFQADRRDGPRARSASRLFKRKKGAEYRQKNNEQFTHAQGFSARQPVSPAPPASPPLHSRHPSPTHSPRTPPPLPSPLPARARGRDRCVRARAVQAVAGLGTWNVVQPGTLHSISAPQPLRARSTDAESAARALREARPGVMATRRPDYDYLIKLLLIGDSGALERLGMCSKMRVHRAILAPRRPHRSPQTRWPRACVDSTTGVPTRGRSRASPRLRPFSLQGGGL